MKTTLTHTEQEFLGSLDDNLDELLEEIRDNSEDFGEREYWCGKWYREVNHSNSDMTVRSWLFGFDNLFTIIDGSQVHEGRWKQRSSNSNLIDVAFVKDGMEVTEAYYLGAMGKNLCLVLERHGEPALDYAKRYSNKYVALHSMNEYKKGMMWKEYLVILEEELSGTNWLLIILFIFSTALIFGGILLSIW